MAEPTIAWAALAAQRSRLDAHQIPRRRAKNATTSLPEPSITALPVAHVQQRKLRLASGTLVPPMRARLHLERLRAAGFALPQLAAMSGISVRTLHVITAQVLPVTIAAATERAILTLDVDLTKLAPHQRIDATGTYRRLEALAVLGWPNRELAARLGYPTRKLTLALIRRHPKVCADFALRVRDLYTELANSNGDCATTRERAHERGWHGPDQWEGAPIEGWESDEALSAPTDDVDDAVIERVLASDPVPYTRAERLQVIRVGARRGLTDEAIAAKLGICSRTVLRERRAHDVAPGGMARAS